MLWLISERLLVVSSGTLNTPIVICYGNLNNSLGWPFEGPKDQQSSIFPLSRIRVLSVEEVASKRVVGDSKLNLPG